MEREGGGGGRRTLPESGWALSQVVGPPLSSSSMPGSCTTARRHTRELKLHTARLTFKNAPFNHPQRRQHLEGCTI